MASTTTRATTKATMTTRRVVPNARRRVASTRGRTRARGDDGDDRDDDDAATARAVLARMASYDWLSAGVGSCLCAGYFVWRGSEVGSSLTIAATATIAAVAFEEMLREGERGGW